MLKGCKTEIKPKIIYPPIGFSGWWCCVFLCCFPYLFFSLVLFGWLKHIWGIAILPFNLYLKAIADPKRVWRFSNGTTKPILSQNFNFIKQFCRMMWDLCKFSLTIWATIWQNQQSSCAPSEDSYQPGHPPSLIRVFPVRMKKAWVLSYPLIASNNSDQTGRMPRLIWVFAGRTVTLLVLSRGGSFLSFNPI